MMLSLEAGYLIPVGKFDLDLFFGGNFFQQPTRNKSHDLTESNGTVTTHTEGGNPNAIVDSTTDYNVTVTTDGDIKYKVNGGGFSIGTIARNIDVGRKIKLDIGPMFLYHTAQGNDNKSSTTIQVYQDDQTTTTVSIPGTGVNPWTDVGPENINDGDPQTQRLHLKRLNQHTMLPAVEGALKSPNTYSELVLVFPVSNQSENADNKFRLIDWHPELQVLGLYRIDNKATLGGNITINSEEMGGHLIGSTGANLEKLAQYYSTVNHQRLMRFMDPELEDAYLGNLEMKTFLLDVDGPVAELGAYGTRKIGQFQRVGFLLSYSKHKPKIFGGIIGEYNYWDTEKSHEFKVTGAIGREHLAAIVYAEGKTNSIMVPGDGFEWQAGIGAMIKLGALPEGYPRHHYDQKPAGYVRTGAEVDADNAEAKEYETRKATQQQPAKSEAPMNTGAKADVKADADLETKTK
jgi:hypothetical protein